MHSEAYSDLVESGEAEGVASEGFDDIPVLGIIDEQPWEDQLFDVFAHLIG